MRRNQHYHDRVNRALDYISEHLDSDLSLAQLSAVSCFSPFHFHRVFQGITGETLNTHVRRVRLERAALLLRTSPRKRITDVALETGFGGTAEFSRAFRNHFGHTASSWDRASPLEKSKIGKDPDGRRIHTVEELEQWRAANGLAVRIHRLSAFRYAYVRIFAPYAGTRLIDTYHALVAWLKERGTDFRDVVFIGMSLDDPTLTAADKCRHDLGIAFPRDSQGVLPDILLDILDARNREDKRKQLRAVPPEQSECDARGFSLRDFEPGQIVSAHCAGDISHMERAWHYLYRVWLPESGYEPADQPAMEMFVRIPEEIGWTTFNLHACIPVARL